MKSLPITFLLSLLAFAGQATVFTVDNREGTTANYQTVTNAIAAAANGDTLYVHPSIIVYDNDNRIVLNKSLVIIGPGHHSESVQTINARVRGFDLRTGSSGSYIIGLELGDIKVANFNVSSNITIENNLITSAIALKGSSADNSNSSNWVIRGNIFYSTEGCGGCILIDNGTGSRQFGPNENWVVNNNLIHTPPSCCGGSTILFGSLNGSSVLLNNTFFVKGTSSLFAVALNDTNEDALLMNNIFHITTSTTSISDDCVDCLFENNLTYSNTNTLSALPGASNLDNQEPVFVNVPDINWAIEYDYNLTSGSPGVDAGADGTDVGIYGSAYRFSKYGYPPGLPRVSELRIQNPIVQEGQDLIVNLKGEISN